MASGRRQSDGGTAAAFNQNRKQERRRGLVHLKGSPPDSGVLIQSHWPSVIVRAGPAGGAGSIQWRPVVRGVAGRGLRCPPVAVIGRRDQVGGQDRALTSRLVPSRSSWRPGGRLWRHRSCERILWPAPRRHSAASVKTGRRRWRRWCRWAPVGSIGLCSHETLGVGRRRTY